MKRFAFALLAAFALAAPSAFAKHINGHDSHDAAVAPADRLTAGVVKKIDKDAGKISIAHEAIENLGMPSMTMVFRVKDPGMLDAVKEGDKIIFLADRIGGALTVTKIEAAK